jgi:hypothetical protein
MARKTKGDNASAGKPPYFLLSANHNDALTLRTVQIVTILTIGRCVEQRHKKNSFLKWVRKFDLK